MTYHSSRICNVMLKTWYSMIRRSHITGRRDSVIPRGHIGAKVRRNSTQCISLVYCRNHTISRLILHWWQAILHKSITGLQKKEMIITF
jgi:hypothetical protein